MKIVGLNHDMFISSAALVEDGQITAAAAEERFLRQKHTRKFPHHSLDYCLEAGNIDIQDVDVFVSSWNPGVYLESFNPLISDNRRLKAEYLYSIPDNIFRHLPEGQSTVDRLQQKFVLNDREIEVSYVTHHRAHAANGYFPSPFDEAAILTADSQGEKEAITFSRGQGHLIELLQAQNHPHSLGVLYSTITEYLGFRANSDEWKVMAVAANSDTKNQFDRVLEENLVNFLDTGRIELDLSYFTGHLPDQGGFYSNKLIEILGPPRVGGSPLTERHIEIAGALQRLAEKATWHLLAHLHRLVRSVNLAVSGGFFMNSVINGKIAENSPFENVFVSSCPDDSGNAIGAALYHYHHISGNPHRSEMTHNFFGPAFDQDQIAKSINQVGLEFALLEDAETHTAKLLADGKIVGWFQGHMEFGQRALGNRSILADPRDPSMKDRLNAKIKFRENFRPFAPAVLSERATDYFEMGSINQIPFMEKVIPVRPEMRPKLPAITHYDGSARVQTVDQRSSPKFHNLISRFQSITGVPILLNTSFNLNGEPIVCTPDDAIRAFYSCGMDALVIGNCLIEK